MCIRDREYIITREISSTGKSTCRINDEIVTLGTLSALCRKLADIHGQYDHQSLLNPDYHINLVDLYRKEDIEPAKKTVSEVYEKYTELKSQLSRLISQSASDKRQQDFMAFELQELENASLREGEDEELEKEITLLRNSERIYASLAASYDMGSESEVSILYGLKKICDLLSETASYSAELGEMCIRDSPYPC